MKKALTVLLMLFFLAGMAACTEKDTLYRGVYESVHQKQEMDDPELVQYPEEDPVSYEQYKKERKEAMSSSSQE